MVLTNVQFISRIPREVSIGSCRMGWVLCHCHNNLKVALQFQLMMLKERQLSVRVWNYHFQTKEAKEAVCIAVLFQTRRSAYV